MADIELVIKIPKELYETYKGMPPMFGDAGMNMLVQSIANGTPLPKGHGRLIDAKKFEAYIRDGFRDLKGEFKTEKYRNLAEQLTESFLMDIQEQETVVPADKEKIEFLEEECDLQKMEWECEA